MADPEIPVTPQQVDTSAAIPQGPPPIPQGQGPTAPPPGTPGVSTAPAGTGNAPDTSNLPAGRSIEQRRTLSGTQPSQLTPQQADNVKHNIIGRAFSAIAGPQGEKPGQLFRSILAATILGGAAGAGQHGFGAGMNAGFKAQQEQQQQLQQQKRQAVIDQQNSQKAEDEHLMHQVAVKNNQLSQILTQQQIDKMSADKIQALADARKATLAFYKNVDGSQEVNFNVDGKPTNEISVSDFMKQATKDPSIFNPVDSKNYVRHYLVIPSVGDPEKVDFVNGRWIDPDTHEQVNLSDTSTIQGYDIPTASLKKASMVDGDVLSKKYPEKSYMWKPGTSYPVTPEQSVALDTEHNKNLVEQAKIDASKAEKAKFDAERNKTLSAGGGEGSMVDVTQKYNIPAGATGQAVLDHLPSGYASFVKKVAYGEISSQSLSTYIRQHAIGHTREEVQTLASLVNPRFNEDAYANRKQADKEIIDSKREGGQIYSLNKFLGHTGDAFSITDQWRQDQKNGVSNLINTPMNKLREIKGDTAIERYKVGVLAPADEYLNFLKNNHAPLSNEVEKISSFANTNLTPAQLEEVLREMAEVGTTQAIALNQGYRTVSGQNIPNLIEPYSRTALHKLTSKDHDFPSKIKDLDTGGFMNQVDQSQVNPQQSQTPQYVRTATDPTTNTKMGQKSDGTWEPIKGQ